MLKILKRAGLALMTVAVLLPSTAFSWGWAVHTYIDGQFNTKWAVRNSNQIYGGLAPDLFNFRYDRPDYQAYLIGQTHYSFMELWVSARSVPAKALAFGFVSHNEEWGVDRTAHRSGITFGEGEGYVIVKAAILKGILDQIPQFAALQLPDPVALAVAHELVERGVDILMKQVDPQLGATMADAALPPNPEFPLIMEQVYGPAFASSFGISEAEASRFIASSERQFRRMMYLYGQALMEDDATTILLNAEQLEEIAKNFLAAYGLPPLPEGLDIKPLLQYGIILAMDLCAPDFAQEVFATIIVVEQELLYHGIFY